MSRGGFGEGFRRGRGIPQPLGPHLRECPTVAVEDRVAAGLGLPAKTDLILVVDLIAVF